MEDGNGNGAEPGEDWRPDCCLAYCGSATFPPWERQIDRGRHKNKGHPALAGCPFDPSSSEDLTAYWKSP